jgi:hypothetical protein
MIFYYNSKFKGGAHVEMFTAIIAFANGEHFDPIQIQVNVFIKLFTLLHALKIGSHNY